MSSSSPVVSLPYSLRQGLVLNLQLTLLAGILVRVFVAVIKQSAVTKVAGFI